jgi:hypothetical protein
MLIEFVTFLGLENRKYLLDIIEQRVFEAEEATYTEDVDTKAEIDAVKLEYRQGEFMAIDDFIQAQPN